MFGITLFSQKMPALSLLSLTSVRENQRRFQYWMKSTLILGLGNSLRGDDGAGPAVVAALSQMNLPPYVELIDGGTPGLETVLLFEGYERVIIVDVAEMSLEAGEWRRFTPDTAEIRSNDHKLVGTLHAAGLAEALALAGALGMLPETVVIYGIQPKQLDWSEGLTAPLQAALPSLCDEISQIVE
jgi:hydrogenase maturation protease